MQKIFFFLCAIFALAAVPVAAQTALPGATGASTTLTVSCPSPATGSEIWRATGSSSTVTLASANWTELGVVAAAGGTYTDATGAAGTTYGYTAICTEGATLAPPTAIYFGTPTSPLAAGTLSGATS